MIKYFDQKMTPNQFAKYLILDAIEMVMDSPLENDPVWEGMTDREKEALDEQLDKRIESVYRVLGALKPDGSKGAPWHPYWK